MKVNFQFVKGICATQTKSGLRAYISESHNTINNRCYFNLRIVDENGKGRTAVTRGGLDKIAKALENN